MSHIFAAAHNNNNWDTFDDLPEAIRTQNFLHAYLSSKKSNVGIIVRGNASQTFACTAYWGAAIQLSSNETLQIRMYPKGMLIESASRISPRVIILAARRRGPLGDDQTTFAIIWNDRKSIEHIPIDVVALQKASVKTVAARSLHLMLPSLFNHHDPYWDTKHAKSEWPVLDEQHFHAVRSSSFSIFKAASGNSQLINAAAGGISQFVLAGQFAGVDVQDKPHRAAEPISYAHWKAVCSKYASQIEKGSKNAFDALHATMSAMAVTDLMTAEGIIGLISQPVLDGALPDMVHTPGGFPLLIAFACRLACYPRRFGLSDPTTEDLWANRELIALFESNWSAVSPMKAGPKNLYAIDLVLKSAWKDASTHAKTQNMEQATNDNILFWQRVGQRCISSLWGPTREDFNPVSSIFGPSEKTMCPLAEARSRVMRSTMLEHDSVVPNEIDMLPATSSSASVSTKRQTLLRMMDAVEGWLRNGQYAGLQISARNPKIPLRGITKRAKTAKSKQELTDALNLGYENSVREMLESGEAQSEEQARSAATLLRGTIEEWLDKCNDNGELDFSDVAHLCPELKLKKVDTPEEDKESGESSTEYQLKLECGIDKDNVCVDAFRGGISCIAAAMCQGPMVHHQFRDLRIYATSEGAKNICADCDSEVHVLQASFLSTRFSECTTCKRARCLNCSEIAASRALKKKGTSVQVIGCLRCKPSPKESHETTCNGQSEETSSANKKKTKSRSNKST
tara:strand:+ start:9488 stop:11707 length:2220 start_codon:yes stop_codon:yes gene_type:complete